MPTPPDIVSRVLPRIRPSPGEARALAGFCRALATRVGDLARQRGLPAAPMLVGSSARDTWLPGDLDVDLFLLFPPDWTKERMKTAAVGLARRLGSRWTTRYAEHPYVRLWVTEQELAGGKGKKPASGGPLFQVDLVPCYRVEDPRGMMSAVDRTPFHQRYLEERVQGREDEVRLLKQFLAGAGVYGAELRVQGFSGYLCELLVLHYGGFLPAVEAMAQWRPGVRLDPSGQGTYSGREPLVFVDPVDPGRNVAAALSPENFSRCVAHARSFLGGPSRRHFFPPAPRPLPRGEALRRFRARGTRVWALEFQVPGGLVDDIVYPQLRKAEASLREMAGREGFRVHRSGVLLVSPPEMARGAGKLPRSPAFVFLEFEVWSLPPIRDHPGPPVSDAENSRVFQAKHRGRPLRVDGTRWVAEVPRRYTRAEEALRGEAGRCGLGRDLARCPRRLVPLERVPWGPGVALFLRRYLSGNP